jgi:hypothetical protein
MANPSNPDLTEDVLRKALTAAQQSERWMRPALTINGAAGTASVTVNKDAMSQHGMHEDSQRLPADLVQAFTAASNTAAKACEGQAGTLRVVEADAITPAGQSVGGISVQCDRSKWR